MWFDTIYNTCIYHYLCWKSVKKSLTWHCLMGINLPNEQNLRFVFNFELFDSNIARHTHFTGHREPCLSFVIYISDLLDSYLNLCCWEGYPNFSKKKSFSLSWVVLLYFLKKYILVHTNCFIHLLELLILI